MGCRLSPAYESIDPRLMRSDCTLRIPCPASPGGTIARRHYLAAGAMPRYLSMLIMMSLSLPFFFASSYLASATRRAAS